MRRKPFIVKRLLPRSLFGRALLIIILPTVLIQLISTYVFFERHWENVQRHMAESLAGEVAFIAEELDTTGHSRRRMMAYDMYRYLGLEIRFMDGQQKVALPALKRSDRWLQPLAESLKNKLSFPHRLSFDERQQKIIVQISLKSGTAEVTASRKRVSSPTTYIYVMWMAGAAIVFMFVAILFLRNQIRPIIRLARAADQFGKGRDVPDFKPSGAREVRKAAQAFQRMRERISRLIQNRTEMLAAISHDLRTPITRMKLELAMLKDQDVAKALVSDLATMESMIEEYLDFVRGEGGEATELTDVDSLVKSIVSDYQRHQQPVNLHGKVKAERELRPIAIRRCLNNIIDNGLHYGSQVDLHILQKEDEIILYIDDNGPGIPKAERQDALKAFRRLEQSRNLNTGGAGLGLAIAKDIVISHGGTLFLQDAPEGGLRVEIRLGL